MKCSIEETKQMLESHYSFTDPTAMFIDIKYELVEIVKDQLGLESHEAYKFVCSWFDNRH